MRIPAILTRTALWRDLGTVLEGLKPAQPCGPVVAICHCHHPELVPELARALRHLGPQAKLHLSSSRSAVFERWKSLRRKPAADTQFHLVENRGRDIRPFLEVARALPVGPDALVLKVHGKMSSYSTRGQHWRQDLLAGLLPGRVALGRINDRFRGDPRLGLLGAPRSFISHPVYWGENRRNVQRIMSESFGVVPQEQDLGFFAGSMFWIRGRVLLDLLAHIDLDAFEPEPLPQDGTYAHAVERVIPMAARHLGWRLGEVGLDGVIEPDDVRDRKVGYI